MTLAAATQVTPGTIIDSLSELPPGSLVVVKQFVEFLREQAQRGQPVVAAGVGATPYLYPTVAAPASSLKGWVDLIPNGCGGDALADTEALYDEV